MGSNEGEAAGKSNILAACEWEVSSAQRSAKAIHHFARLINGSSWQQRCEFFAAPTRANVRFAYSVGETTGKSFQKGLKTIRIQT